MSVAAIAQAFGRLSAAAWDLADAVDQGHEVGYDQIVTLIPIVERNQLILGYGSLHGVLHPCVLGASRLLVS